MDEATALDRRAPGRPPVSTDSAGAPGKVGVRGWLLVLCVMLTVVGPVISAGLMAHEYGRVAPHFDASRLAQVATLFSIAINTGSVLFGIDAGLRLWAIRPGAVDVARAALLVGLVVDIVTTTISTAMWASSPVDDRLFYEVLMNLVPSLVFFTACLAYLNKSTRVEATYPPTGSSSCSTVSAACSPSRCTDSTASGSRSRPAIDARRVEAS